MSPLREFLATVACAALLVSLAPGAPATATDATYVTHAPITITSQTALVNEATAEHWPGTGTAADPYIIQGYDIAGGTSAGILMYGSISSAITIRGNRIHDSPGHGILLEYNTGAIRVDANIVSNVGSVGIYLLGLHGASVTGNTVTNAGWTAIDVLFGSYTVTGNVVTQAGTATSGAGYGLIVSVDTTTTASGNAVHGVSGTGALLSQDATTSFTGNTFDGIANDGIEVAYANAATLAIASNVVAAGAVYGVPVHDASLLAVTGNTVTNATRGVFVERSSRLVVAANALTGNGEGLTLDTVTASTARTNTLAGNGVDLHLILAHGNVVFDNRFESAHTVRLQLSPDNRWNVTKVAGTNVLGGAFLGGNAWPDYTGVDVDQDGLGDVPYGPIPVGVLPRDTVVEDTYASMMPYGPYDQHPLMSGAVATGITSRLPVP
ncbi:MAG: right-handed parallel beta-helix repeat-containing protein [Thermoplasmatota archaeon]